MTAPTPTTPPAPAASWWERNAAENGAAGGDFYADAYQSSTQQAAPTSDARTGETFDHPQGPAVGYPFGRPAAV